MQNLTRSPKEKQLARKVFERTTAAEEQELLEHFKTKSAKLKRLEECWALQSAIRDSERAYQRKYDYRYSELVIIFGRLVRDGRISIDELNGPSEDKLRYIGEIASL